MLIDPKDALRSVARHLQQNPELFKLLVHNVRDYKLTIPLDMLRYVAKRAESHKKAPKEVTIEATPPGLKLGGLLKVMGATVRFSATVHVDEIRLNPEELFLQLRLSGVNLLSEGGDSSPLTAVIKSGILDLSKPGNLARYLPDRPPIILDAVDDRISLDLMKDKKLKKNPKFTRTIALISPLFGLRNLSTEGDSLVLELIPKREGVTELLERARSAVRKRFS